MDVYERAQKDDLMEASVIMAAFVYDAAMRDQMLPRKPLGADTQLMRADEKTAEPAAKATVRKAGKKE
jgi:hypothetical protein